MRKYFNSVCKNFTRFFYFCCCCCATKASGKYSSTCSGKITKENLASTKTKEICIQYVSELFFFLPPNIHHILHSISYGISITFVYDYEQKRNANTWIDLPGDARRFHLGNHYPATACMEHFWHSIHYAAWQNTVFISNAMGKIYRHQTAKGLIIFFHSCFDTHKICG